MAAKPTIAGELIRHRDVILADAIYVDCVFDGCNLVFDGRTINVDGCDFQGCDWHMADAAGRTIEMLKSMWTTGSDKTVAKVIGHIVGRDPREIHDLLTK